MESRVIPEGGLLASPPITAISSPARAAENTPCAWQTELLKSKKDCMIPNVTTTVSAKDWIAITLGKLDGMTAFSSGKLKVEGDLGPLTKATGF
ncbi:MAG: SCP2 sterol-binding domain-containing protein [Desulfobacterales bacterium]